MQNIIIFVDQSYKAIETKYFKINRQMLIQIYGKI